MYLIYVWLSRWLFSTNSKDIGTLHFIFGASAGVVGTMMNTSCNLKPCLKVSFKKNKDMIIQVQNMLIMDCMSGNLLSTLQNHSDLIISGLKITGFLGISGWGLFTIYNKWSGSKGKGNDNSGESTADTTNNIANSDSSTSLENSNLFNNTENTVRYDETINEQVSSIQRLDLVNILNSLEDKLSKFGLWCSNEEFVGEKYYSLLEELVDESHSIFDQFRDLPGFCTLNLKNFIDMEGAVEYFSLLRLSRSVDGVPAILDCDMMKKLFLVASAVTLFKKIKDGNLPKKFHEMRDRLSSAEEIDFLSNFSIQDYFRSFKESFLYIIFHKDDGNPNYCPKKNGVRIIEDVIFNDSNMKIFISVKFPQYPNQDLDVFTSSRASRAYSLDENHSIFDALDNALDNQISYLNEDPGRNMDIQLNSKLKNKSLTVNCPYLVKSPYIICLWNYAMGLKNRIKTISVYVHEMRKLRRGAVLGFFFHSNPVFLEKYTALYFEIPKRN